MFVACAGVGAGWVRIEYKDSAGVGSPPTPSTLSFYKAKSGAMQGAGIQVLMILDYSSLPGRPAASGSSAQWQTYTSAFAKYVYIYASRKVEYSSRC